MPESEALLLNTSAKLAAPKINHPPWSSMESLYTGGMSLSPGSITLVSSFFAENDSETDFHSFSQMLSGATASPLRFDSVWKEVESISRAGELRFHLSGPTEPVASQPPAIFAITPEPMYENSMNFQVLFPNSQEGFSSQMVSQSQMEFDFSLSGLQHQPPSISYNSMKETSEISYSDNKPHSFNTVVDKPADDGYNWRKYGQKQVKGSEFPRSYYKCTHSNCPVKKKVERSLQGHITAIIYKGQHNHSSSSKRTRDMKIGFEGLIGYQYKPNGIFLESSHEHLSGCSDGEEVETKSYIREQYEPDFKKRNVHSHSSVTVSSNRTGTEARIIVQTTSEIELLDDGYKWRKYGQKVVKGNPHPRSYYKCTSQDCTVRKHIERVADNPRAVLTTYEGKHNHDVPVSRTSAMF